MDLGMDCPEVYGDPALLAPMARPRGPVTHRIGVIVRHSENRWRQLDLGDG